MHINKSLIESLISAIGNDGVKELLDAYVVSTQDVISSLNKAVEEEDAENMRFYGHRLKGSSGTLGLSTMENLGREIEKFSMANDVDSAKADIEKVETNFLTTIESLKQTYPSLF